MYRLILLFSLTLVTLFTLPIAAQEQLAKLTASDAAAQDRFGRSVSLSGDVAIVGAPQQFSGAAYVYRFDGTTWSEEQKLTASDGAAGDAFGTTVSVSGPVAVVGAPLHDDAGNYSGAAYVYRFNGTTWTEEQKLIASDAAAEDFFGGSVAVDGNVVVVGAHGDDDAGSRSGAVYVYRFGGMNWIEEQKLTASDGVANDAFGVSVSTAGDVKAMRRKS